MNYKNGDKVWCRIYNKLRHDKDLMYCGPGVIVYKLVKMDRYEIEIPLCVSKHVPNQRTWIVKGKHIDYEL